MTFVVAAMTPESIWLAVDRRLSYPHRVPKDDARKAMILETDGWPTLSPAVGEAWD